jgi:Spy/CpxP family protein refolding chaperone
MKKIVIAFMVAATSAIAFAQPAAPPPLHPHGQRARLAATLNLTDAQKQQLKDIRIADRAQNKQLYADFRAKVRELRALKQANDPGAAGVEAQLKAMRPQLKAARKANREAVRNLLTPDQRAQLKAARQSRRLARGPALRGTVAQKLNLTDAQKAQIKQLHETNVQQNAQLFADVRARRQELHALKQANDPRASDVKAQIRALRPQLEAARQQQHDAVINVLTAEQRAQLEQWKAERQSRRSSR